MDRGELMPQEASGKSPGRSRGGSRDSQISPRSMSRAQFCAEVRLECEQIEGIPVAAKGRGNGTGRAQQRNAGAFRETIFTGLRARGKGLAPRLVRVVPTCL